MNFYKKLFSTNIIISMVYTFIFTILVSSFSFSFSKESFDTNLNAYVNFAARELSNNIQNVKTLSSTISANDYIQSYASEAIPDYPNRKKACSFLLDNINPVAPHGCSIAVAKVDDNHIISAESTSTFDYYCASKGFSTDAIASIIQSFESQPLHTIQYAIGTTKDDSYLAIITQHNTDSSNNAFYVFSTLSLNTLLNFDSYNNLITPFITQKREITYIKDKALLDVATNYMESGKSKYKIISHSPDTKNSESDIAYHFILSDKFYYFQFIPTILLSLLMCIPIYILGFLIMRKITNNIYRPIANLLSFLPKKGKTIENEFEFVLSEYHKLENISSVKTNLINQFKLSSKDKFTMDLLFGTISSKQIYEYRAEHNLLDINGEFVVSIIEYSDYDTLSKNLSRGGIYNLKTAVASYFSELFFKEKLCLVTETSQNNHVLILSCDDTHELRQKLQSALLQIMADLDVELYAAIGDTVSSYSSISDSYRTATEILRRRMLSLEHKVITTAQDMKNVQDNKIVYLPDIESKLISSTITCNAEKVNSIINEIFSNNSVYSNEGFAQLVIMLYSTIQKILYNINSSENEIFGEDTSVYLDLKECKNMNSLNLRLTAHLNTIMFYLSQKQTSLLSARSSEMIEYVNNNYTKEDLSLISLSEYMNMSQAYISKLFKQETGTNFKEYLMMLRYKKAKELMEKNPQMLQKDIATAVGYTNAKALARLLKKYE